MIAAKLRQLASYAARGRGSVSGMEETKQRTVETRGLRGAEAAAVLRFGLGEESGAAGDGGAGDGTPAEGPVFERVAGQQSRPGGRAAVVGSVTLAVLLAAGVGFPHSGKDPAYGGLGAGSVDGPEGVAADSSVADRAGFPQQEPAQMSISRNSVRATMVAGAALIAASAGAQTAVQWRVSDGGNGHWYQRNGQALSWTAARQFAVARGGDLATLTTKAESNFAFEVDGRIGNCWLGGFQVAGACEPTCEWAWVTGEAWVFSAWRPGQPDNTSGTEGSLCFWGGEAVWNDGTGSVTAPSVIEWSADCNNDNIIDYGQCRNGELADYDSDNTPDCCERGESCVVGNYPVEWQTTDGGNGHWYLLDIQQAGIDWPDANSISMASGGKLSQIESLMECQYLFDLCARDSSAWNQSGGGALGPWLGGRQQPGAQEPSGGWLWTDGSSIDFAVCRFVGSDPSGCGINEDRMSFWCQDARDVYAGSVAYETSDYPAGGICGNLGPIRAFLVEWSMDCNNDDIVDFGQILTGQLADANANGIPDICEGPTCQDADLYRNGRVDGADLAALLSEWGPVNPFTHSDFNHDDLVDGSDLAFLLANWGPCPQ